MTERKINQLSLLESIYDAYLEDIYFIGADEINKRQTFSALYNVTEFQTLVLAYLVHYHPAYIVEDRLISQYSDYVGASPVEEIHDLKERGFISSRVTSGDSNCYQIEEGAYHAFRNGEVYGRGSQIDCLNEIKTAPLYTLLSSYWKIAFYRRVEFSEDRQLAAGIEELMLKQYSSSIQDAFWVLVWQFCNRFTVPFAFRSTGGGSLEGIIYDEDCLKSAMGELVKMGLAGTIPIDNLEETKDTERYVLGVKPVELLFRGREEFIRYDDISKQVNVILARDITPKELFFTEDVQNEIDGLRKLLSPEGFHRASEILRGRKRNPGIHMLLWGPPGTGKTEVIKQMARESGRDILLVDVAKMTQCGWGGTEKCYRALFLGYSYVVAISVNAPILVMNEADHILSRRLTNINSSIAKSENAVSNILLQGFEDMSGILLATTNLVNNMDEAFDRRFLFKIMLPKPGPEARKKIWQSSVPELTDSEAEDLAGKFEMSGGQISNVVAKRDLAELYYEGDRGFEFIVGLCRIEVKEPIQTTIRKIGF